MRRALAALLLFAGSARALAGPDAIAALDACMHRLDPALDVGYAHIAARCPELGAALGGSPYARWLPPDWNKPDNSLSLGGLAELRMLLTREARAQAVTAPRVEHLAAVLAQLHGQESAPRSWWARFKDWLRDLFSNRAAEQGSDWMERLLGKVTLSQAVSRVIVWLSLLALLGVAASIVVNELRVAGVLRPARARNTRAGVAGAAPELTLAEIERVNPREQPPLLLQLIARQLTQQQRLPPSRALTLSELQRAVQLADAGDRSRLAQLAYSCERLRYAADELPAAALAETLRQGRELLVSLGATPVAAAG
jgi:hypothetical protein